MPLLRVREALSSADCRAILRWKLPEEASPPELPRYGYPQSLLKLLGGAEKYANLGIVTELLLRRKVIDQSAVASVVGAVVGAAVPAKLDLTAYLARVRGTRAKMLALAGSSPLLYDAVVTGRGVEGHPDARTSADVFEVKTSGRVQSCWNVFLLQLFAYAALDPAVERIHLVLPLQDFVWSWDVAGAWPKRDQFREALENYAAGQVARRPSMEQMLALALEQVEEESTIDRSAEEREELEDAPLVIYLGSHISVRGGIVKALQSLDLSATEETHMPFQIFLGAPNTTSVRITDEEVAECRKLIEARGLQVFVHAPYLVNLCAFTPYNVACLTRQLRLGHAMGAKGVVAHVGKACKMKEQEALDVMRSNLLEILEAASPECPLLLETPAGQGTEVLAGAPEEFFAFIDSFADSRFGACVDTCHVFAAGTRPLDYIRVALDRPHWRKLLRLIHFNDSERPLGSRVDRHAPWGRGHIGVSEMNAIAKKATKAGIPLVSE